MHFWDIPPVFHRILGIPSHFAADPLYPAVSHCIQLYPYASSCIQLYLLYPAALRTGYGQTYTPGENIADTHGAKVYAGLRVARFQNPTMGMRQNRESNP